MNLNHLMQLRDALAAGPSAAADQAVLRVLVMRPPALPSSKALGNFACPRYTVDLAAAMTRVMRARGDYITSHLLEAIAQYPDEPAPVAILRGLVDAMIVHAEQAVQSDIAL